METTICSFCNKDRDFPIAGPGVVICKDCVTSCVKACLGETPLVGQPRIVKQQTLECNFCGELMARNEPLFTKNQYTICANCIKLCLSAYLEKEAGVSIKRSGAGVIYAF